MSPPAPPTPPASRPRSARLTQAWHRKGPLAISLLPLSALYAALGAIRRWLYQQGWLSSFRAPVPVVVVGNVIAGGAGKTPVTMHLVQALQALGWQPAVISRGYGRQAADQRAAREVRPGDDPRLTGDEPLLIAERTRVPVFVARQRATAAQAVLQAYPHIDVLVCDDGLQHLALARDVEIAVFNRHGVGNGWQLPAGPLREPWPRALDAVVYALQPPAGLAGTTIPAWPMQRQLADYALTREGHRIPLSSLQRQPVRAMAAIAYPQDFFAMLQTAGLTLTRCDALPDHADLADPHLLAQLELGDDTPHRPTIDTPALLCTEKDAHKLWRIAPWALAVPLTVAIAPAFAQQIHQRLLALRPSIL